MNEFNIKGLMTAQEYATRRGMTLEELGISQEYAKVHFFFIASEEEDNISDNPKKMSRARQTASNFTKKIKQLSKSTKKVIFIQEGSPYCDSCKLEYANFHGLSFYKRKEGLKKRDYTTYGNLFFRAKEKPFNYFLLDPFYSEFLSSETKSKIEKIGFTSLEDYQKYIQDNFLFIFSYSHQPASFLYWQIEKRKGDRTANEKFYKEAPFYTPPLGQYYEIIDGRFYLVSEDFYKKSRHMPNYSVYLYFLKNTFEASEYSNISDDQIFDLLIAATKTNTLDSFSFDDEKIKKEIEKLNTKEEEAQIIRLKETINKNSVFNYLSNSFPDATFTQNSEGEPVITFKNNQTSLNAFIAFLESTEGSRKRTIPQSPLFASPEEAKGNFFSSFDEMQNGHTVQGVYLPNTTPTGGGISLLLEYNKVKDEIQGTFSGRANQFEIENISVPEIKFDSISSYAPFIKPYLRDSLSHFVNTFLDHYLQLRPYIKKETAEPVSITPAVAPLELPPQPAPEPPTPPPVVVIPPPPPPPPVEEPKPEPKVEAKEESLDLKHLTADNLKMFESLNKFLTGSDGKDSPFQPWLQKDYVSNIFTKTKVLPLTIENGPDFTTKDNVLVSVSGGINSLTANIPILGQAYPTTQFLSSMEPNYQLNIIASNNMHANGLEDSASDLPNAIKRLEEINSITLRTAREYKFVPDGSSILIDSFITRLFGSFREEYVILDSTDNLGSYYVTLKKPISIESTEYRTLESNPGASAYSMRFSETNVYDAEALKEVTTNKKLKNEKLYQDVVSYALMNCDDISNDRAADIKENIVSTINTTDPFEWQTKFFKSWDFFKQFGNKKDALRKKLTDANLALTVNENLYALAINILDPLYEFLNENPETKKIFTGIFISSGFSDTDNDSRNTFSQHYYGAAADIVVPNFNALYIASTISKICEKRQIKLGLGVYGLDVLAYKERQLAGSGTDPIPVRYSTAMGGNKSTNGFIHVDLRLKMLDENKYDVFLGKYATDNSTNVEALKVFDKKKYKDLTAPEKTKYNDLKALKLLSLKDDAFYNNGNVREYQPNYFWSADTTGEYKIKVGNSVNLFNSADLAVTAESYIDIFRTKILQSSDKSFWSLYLESQDTDPLSFLDRNINKRYDDNNTVAANPSITDSKDHPQFASLFVFSAAFSQDSVSIGAIEDVDNINEIDDQDTDTDGSYAVGLELDLENESTGYDTDLQQETFFKQMDELFERDAIDRFFGANYAAIKYSKLEEGIRNQLNSKEITNESLVYTYTVEEKDDLTQSDKYNEFLGKYKNDMDEDSPTTADVLNYYFSSNKINAYVEESPDSDEGTVFTIYLVDPTVASTFSKRQTSNAAEEIKVKRLINMICDFNLLAGILLIEPFVYTDNKADAQKELALINSNFYGINVSPMYFNNLFFAITGSSLESSQSDKSLSTSIKDNIGSMNVKSFFYKFRRDSMGSSDTAIYSSGASAAIALLIACTGVGVVALVFGALISSFFLVKGLDENATEAGQKSQTAEVSSSWSNLLVLKKIILDQAGDASYKNELVTLRALERIYTKIAYETDLVFSLNILLTKMNDAKEIWGFTTDIVKQFIIKNPVILKYEKAGRDISLENKGITFNLSNIINQKYFDEDNAAQEKGSLADNKFIDLGHAERWLKYILGFPYKVNSWFDDTKFNDNHAVFFDSKDKDNIAFSYFNNLSKETMGMYDEELFLKTEEAKKKVEELKKTIQKLSNNPSQKKAEAAFRLQILTALANIDLSNTEEIIRLYNRLYLNLSVSTLDSSTQVIFDLLKSEKTITSKVLDELKKNINLFFSDPSYNNEVIAFSVFDATGFNFGLNQDYYSMKTKDYVSSILPESAVDNYNQAVENIALTFFRIGYPSGHELSTNASMAEIISFYSTISEKEPANDTDFFKSVSQFTLTDNVIAIMEDERLRDLRPKGRRFGYSSTEFKNEFENYLNKTKRTTRDTPEDSEFYYNKLFLPSKSKSISMTNDERAYTTFGKAYSDLTEKEKESISSTTYPEYDTFKILEKYRYSSLKNLFFNIPDGLKPTIYNQFSEHNKKVCGYLKNLLEAIIKELLTSELFNSNLSISDTENTADSFDFGGGKNNYPDIDLPLDPGDFSSNVDLSPGFFYYESDFKDQLLSDIDKRANNILKKSLIFMNHLETGFLTEDGKNLQKGDLADNYVKDIIIDTQDSSSSSYIVKGGDGDDLKERVLGVNNASVKITFQKDSTTALNANDVAFFDVQELIKKSADVDRFKNLEQKLKEIEEKTESIDSAFGSRTGFLNEPKAVLDFYSKYNSKGDFFFFGGEASSAEKQVASKLGLFDDTDLNNTKQDISLVMEQSGRKLFEKQFKMQKAYPTFRFFLVEEDAVESDTYFVFDDFYSFSAVKEFTVYKSKKHAADTAIIRLQNISGTLDGTKMAVIRDVDYEMSEKKITEADAEAKAEKSNTQVIESLVLRPGVACQLRAGYSSNPKELTILLSGRIADVSWSSNGDMCEVVIQSFGVELEVRKYGSSDADSGVSELEFHSTHKLLGWCMFRNELKHFGRFKKERLFQVGINGSESKEVAVSKESYIGTPPGYSDSMFQFFQSNWGWFVIADVLFSIGTVFIGGAGGVVKEIVKDAVQEGVEAVAKTAAKEVGEKAVEGAAAAVAKEGAETVVTEAAKTAAKTSTKASFVSKAAQYLATSMSVLDNVFTGSKWYSKMILSPFRWAFGSGWNPGKNTKIIEEVVQEVTEELLKKNATKEALEVAVKEALEVSNKTSFFSNFKYYVGKALGFNVAYKGARLDRLLSVSPKALLSYFQKAGVNAADNAVIVNLIAKEATSKFTAVYAGRTAFEAVSLGVIKSAKFSILALGIGAGIDLIANTVSASSNYLSELFGKTLNPYAEKIALSPQDDAIYAPHPDRYIKPIDDRLSDKTAQLMKKTGVAILNALSMYQADEEIDVLQKNIILGKTLAMDKRMYSSIGENIFKLKNHTIWEVFHEMSLRHPGWIYGARQYGTGLEYRMFFGIPGQRYFGAPINNRTIYRMNDIIRSTVDNDVPGMKKLLSSSTIASIDSFLSDNFDAGKMEEAKAKVYKMLLRDEWNRVTNKRFIPFRNYHLVSSKFNLVANNIKGVNNDVINEVAVLFVNNSSTDNPEYTQRIIRSHENIPEDQIHGKAIKYDNCKGFNSALRYGTAELMNAAKEMYAGEIIILGNPEINPYDVLLLDDQYSEMYGPIEVESVTHMFGMDTGFITEIKPNALVTANEGLTYPVINSVIMYDVGRELAEKSPFDFADIVKTYRKTGTDKDGKIEEKLNELIEKWFEKEVGVFEMFGAFPNTVNIGITDYLKTDKKGQQAIKDNIKKELMSQLKNNNIILQAEILNKNASIDSLVDTSAITGLLTASAAIAIAATVKFGSSKLPAVFFAALAGGSGGFNSIINKQLQTPDSLLANKLIPGDMLVSQVADGNLIQIFPLVKNNKPLIYGGYDKINAKRRIKNKFGNIFSDFSEAMETFNIMLKEYANRENIIYAEPSFVAEAVGNISDAAQSLLPFKLPAGTLRGYVNSYTPEKIINDALK